MSGLRSFRLTSAEFCATGLLLLLVVAFATRQPVFMAIYGLSAFALVLANIKLLSSFAGREVIAILGLLFALVLTFPVVLIRNPNVLFHLIIVLLSVCVAYILIRDFRSYARASWFTLIIAQSYVLVYLARSGLEDFPLENLLPDSSSNVVTSYLIVLQANACAVMYLLRRQTCLVSAALTLGICIVGYGRSSIIVAAMLLLICTLLSAGGRTRIGSAVGAILIAVCGLLVYLSYQDTINTFIEVNTKIGSGLSDEPRKEIIADYLQKLDGAVPLLFGADYRGTSIEALYFGNPHNSYIRAHNIFGLPYLLCMLAWPLLLDRRHLTGLSRFFVYLMLLLILVRSSTEPLLFPTLFDLYYFALCFALGLDLSRPLKNHP
jgi:hypothetical protein